MNRKTNYETNFFFIIVCIYYLANFLLPFLQYISSVYILLFVVIIIYYYVFRNKYSIKFILPFIPILLLELLSSLLNTTTTKEIVSAFFKMILFALPAYLAFYLLIQNHKKIIILLIISSIILLIITSITSIYQLFNNMDASRMIDVGNQDERILDESYFKNIGGFGIVYIIPILLPMLFTIYKKRRISIFLFIPMMIVLIYYVYLSQFTLAFMLVLISPLSIIISYKYSFRKLIIYGILISLVFLFSRTLFGNILYYFASINDSQLVQLRLTALGDALLGISSKDMAYNMRIDTYNTSINQFFTSPLIGVYYLNEKVGGHSFIFDKLALFGVIGIFALGLFYIHIYKFLYKPFHRESYYGYMIWSLLSSIVLSFINPTPSILVIGLIIPFIAYSMQEKKYVVINNEGKLI